MERDRVESGEKVGERKYRVGKGVSEWGR